MLPFRSILCPVDFSAHATHALRYAATLAGMAGAKLTVAWVTDPLLAQAAALRDLDPQGDQTRADLRDFVAAALPAGAAWLPEPRLVISAGAADREILKIAHDEHADLIVMGTHGLSGYQKMFFGSTTERVLRETTTPVLAIPVADRPIPASSDSPHLDIGTIVVAVDLEDASRALAGFGVSLATALSARPLLMHVVPTESAPPRWRSAVEANQQSALDRAREEVSLLAAETGDGTAETVVVPGRPAEQIAALAATRHAGLIVMGLMSAGGRLAARPGSIAYRVLTLTPTPVLLVPPLSVKA